MSACLASIARQVGTSGERSLAAEAFVLFTLATLFFLLAAFALGAWWMWRRLKQPHVQLMIELENEEGAPAVPSADPPREPEPEPKPWEREADWWRKG
jgi:hypothetical protein